MGRPWHAVASSIFNQSDRIRSACVLEATAPKVGNVHPAASFHDLKYADFVAAADCTAETLVNVEDGVQMGQRVFDAVSRTRQATSTNVNLGIVLLLAPILEAETNLTDPLVPNEWQNKVADVLDRLTPEQGAWMARAIAAAKPGGIKATSDISDTWDVLSDHPEGYDILAAMQHGASRDQIAAAYTDRFRDFFESVVPLVAAGPARCGDLLSGIVHAHIQLLAYDGDSLILRKNGSEANDLVKKAARDCWETVDAAVKRHGSEWASDTKATCAIASLDRTLRSSDHRLNPGTTADLIAAAIYVNLRMNQTNEVT